MFSFILSSENSVGKKYVNKIKENYNNINAGWLLFGTGDMFLPYNLDVDDYPAEDKDYFIENNVNWKKGASNIPVFGKVTCGVPATQWPHGEIKEFIKLEIFHKNAFALVAEGFSMSPYINPKDVLVCVDNEYLIKDGKIVVVVFKSVETLEANAKLIKFDEKELRDNKKITLYSINSKYEPEDYSVKDILRIYKVGTEVLM